MSKNERNGCGCSSIPFSVILLFMGGGYWLYNSQYKDFVVSQSIALFKETISLVKQIPIPAEVEKYIPQPTPKTTITQIPPKSTNSPNQRTKSTPVKPQAPTKKPSAQSSPSSLNKAWQNKTMRGIYLSRYAITNNASEESIRSQVRYLRSQGINTIIHGVWGNACTMYKSQVMQKTFGYASCPNLFQDNWLNWLIDEADKQGMQVHAYFEKGIKIDENSPIFDLAVQRRWIVPGVDRTHPGVDHYVLDVEIPEVAEFFKNILVEFVQKYPKIDAVQWDDYLGYYAELPGKVDRTASLTKFVTNMISQMKKANPAVKFDICHHNP
ncbi:MAG: family 10 glycosylhydrolase, partial [Microcoleaceae cyanobacterium]